MEIARINASIAKNIHRKDMMVDFQQLHENHLYKLDNEIKNTGTILASSYFDNMIASIQWVHCAIKTGLGKLKIKKTFTHPLTK
jgi:hypothetical protein